MKTHFRRAGKAPCKMKIFLLYIIYNYFSLYKYNETFKKNNNKKTKVKSIFEFQDHQTQREKKNAPYIYLEQIENLDTELIVKISITGVGHVVNKYEPIPLSLNTIKK